MAPARDSEREDGVIDPLVLGGGNGTGHHQRAGGVDLKGGVNVIEHQSPGPLHVACVVEDLQHKRVRAIAGQGDHLLVGGGGAGGTGVGCNKWVCPLH